MNYDEMNKNVGNSKLFKVLGWFFLIGGVLVLLSVLSSYISWNAKKSNYNKEYVYSKYGVLYYEDGGKHVYVNKIYNTDGEEITLKLPDKKSAIMYCNKHNTSECIYFDINNTTDQSMENPILGLLVSFFLIALALFALPKKRFNEKKDEQGNVIGKTSSVDSLVPFFIFLFIVGLGSILWQIYAVSSYLSLKNTNNEVTATIYSDIYNEKTEGTSYRSLSYYYVNNKKYIYLDDMYESGTIDDNMGKTIKLYYNPNDPSKVVEDHNPFDFIALLIYIGFIIVSAPFIFFKKKMEGRIHKTLSNQKEVEWKI